MEDGYHKWSEVYDRNLEDIFAVQDEIASSIGDQMRKSLKMHRPKSDTAKLRMENIDAYNLYLKGMFYWNKWSPQSVQKAISFYEKAIELEPDFALPYAGLSACNVFLGAVGIYPPKLAYPKAEKYVLKALMLDNSIPEAHISLAMVKYFGGWNWVGSEKSFIKALELNPNSATAHQYYAMLLATLGYNKKALKEAEMAYQLDPLNAPISANLAFNYYNVNMLEESLEQYNITSEIDPGFHETWSGKAWLYYKMGEIDKAIESYESVLKFPGFRHKSLSGLGYLYAKNGQTEKAEDCLKELEEMETPDLQLDVEFAIIYTGLGDYDKVFEFLNSACDKRLGGLNFIKSKHWKDIQDDSRYIKLVKRMGLPDD